MFSQGQPFVEIDEDPRSDIVWAWRRSLRYPSQCGARSTLPLRWKRVLHSGKLQQAQVQMACLCLG